MAFAVKRTYGKGGHDYLHSWCEEWGTACIGSVKRAMLFSTQSEAEQAASRAQQTCMGFGGLPAQGVNFTAVSV
ncbi:hypothetical protein PZF67_006583 [Pseudomonas aeruginosa]|uniref:hypothetical protein n=1 Tax=Pseudomonas aeruginosa TaxID=287 RepID=UPI0025CB67E8|nr:hypothetical protein [Pseudomonas aeruginosa]